jgi:hypothetical protein
MNQKTMAKQDTARSPTSNNRREANLRHRYGIGIAQYEQLFKEQHGKCGVCDTSHDKLVVDHCHNSSKVRGLLCNNCNVLLGVSKENINTLIAAVNYLLYGYQYKQKI